MSVVAGSLSTVEKVAGCLQLPPPTERTRTHVKPTVCDSFGRHMFAVSPAALLKSKRERGGDYSSTASADDPLSIGPGSQLQLSFSRSEGLCLISAKVI